MGLHRSHQWLAALQRAERGNTFHHQYLFTLRIAGYARCPRRLQSRGRLRVEHPFRRQCDQRIQRVLFHAEHFVLRHIQQSKRRDLLLRDARQPTLPALRWRWRRCCPRAGHLGRRCAAAGCCGSAMAPPSFLFSPRRLDWSDSRLFIATKNRRQMPCFFRRSKLRFSRIWCVRQETDGSPSRGRIGHFPGRGIFGGSGLVL